jgi:hypothetical protein
MGGYFLLVIRILYQEICSLILTYPTIHGEIQIPLVMEYPHLCPHFGNGEESLPFVDMLHRLVRE